jgi:hypothetical protein
MTTFVVYEVTASQVGSVILFERGWDGDEGSPACEFLV